MNTTTTDVATIAPIDHREAMELGLVEYRRFLELLEGLEQADWSRPTDCTEWDVRQMVSHMAGEMAGNASMRENLRQMRRARKGDGPLVDELSALQVRERADATPADLLAEIGRLTEPAIKGRRRTPAPLRALKIPVEMPYGTEKWALGFLIDIVYTRDPWMHRVDISRATGKELVLTPDHDGRIMADIVADWARRHGQPFTLVLGGPAGGSFTAGSGGQTLELDAVEFARILSGRAEGEGLLSQEVPF
jgi:uncharacterized protein (TIGR03083 family)